jgi:hypothetical protein
MFVIVSSYLAKAGEEDAIIALHEHWQHNQGVKAYLSWELLQKVENPREFMDIAHYPSKELAQVALSALDREGWYERLASLTENGQVSADYTSTWRL